MSWEGNTTGQGSTRAGRKARAECLALAGHRCQLRYRGCTGDATDAHHADGLAATGRRRATAIDTRELVAACHSCHNQETQRQATTARNAWKLPTERHPGYRR